MFREREASHSAPMIRGQGRNSFHSQRAPSLGQLINHRHSHYAQCKNVCHQSQVKGRVLGETRERFQSFWEVFRKNWHLSWALGIEWNPLFWCVSLIRLYGGGNGNPLQYSCLGNPMDRGTWWATVHGFAKSRTQLSD